MKRKSTKERKISWGNFLKPETFVGAIVIGIVLWIITETFLGTFFNPLLKRYEESPNVNILGVKLLHIYEEDNDVPVDFPKTTTHSLALIFKVKNLAPTEATAHIAMIKGCVQLNDPLALYDNLADEEKPPEMFQYADYEKFKDAVQRINVTGGVRDDSLKISGYEDSYVGAIFNFSTQGASLGVPGSASLHGNCSKILTPQQHPSISQIFARGQTKPIGNALRPEFATGQLEIFLLVGDKELRVDPEQTAKVYPLLATRWDKLDLAAMYNSPDTDYPPVKK